MLREPQRQGLADRSPPLSPKATCSMKAPVQQSARGMQALHPQHRCRVGCRVKARASYVDETLFGSPVGTRPSVPGFDPPWVQKTNGTRAVGTRAIQSSPGKGSCETTPSGGSTPALTPGKKNRYRLINHTPSYCDESLFGSQPKGTSWEASRMAKGDTAKLHTLFWTPPATPRGRDSPRPREIPLRAVHPSGSSMTRPQVAADSQGLSLDGPEVPRPLRRERSHSLTCLSVPSAGHPASSAPHTNGPQDPRPPPAGMTFRSPLVNPRAPSVSASVPATPRRGRGPQNPKPPWR